MIKIPRGKVACVPLFDPSMTRSGLLHIPDMAKQRCDQGLVKYVGIPEKDSKLDVKIGDHILFSGYTGTLVDLEGEGLLIILPVNFITAKIYDPPTDIPGLYFQGDDKEYFTATYEMAMDLIARGLERTKWYRGLDVKVNKPDVEDYDEWHS